jgi:glycosyltransferase involved in cell wall biosynthesis
MNVTYLLYDTDISRSHRIALAQADLLVGRGHRVRIVTKGLPLTWRTSRAEWVFVDDFRQYNAEADEIVVGLDEITIVDDDVYRERLPRENDPLRVLLAGAWQNQEKGIDDGYGAVAHARWFHQTLDLVRVSPWAPSREEPLETVQEFHVALSAREMTRLTHSCDVILIPGWTEAGFDLTLAEGLAAGLAAVVTDTRPHRSITEEWYASFAPERNPVELGERLIELLGDDTLRENLRARGRRAAEKWRAANNAARLEELLGASA